jgi:hypothetical protein
MDLINTKNRRMITLITDLNVYTYEEYLERFKEWVETKSTSSKNPSHALIAFTKLNWARTQRIQKTLLLNPEFNKAVENIHHSYTWMVLTEAWCGDSAQNLPLIAAIARLHPEKIKLHILLRDENPELMDNYLTNGARSIPKLIAVNDTLGKHAFEWGPRPLQAQQLFKHWKMNSQGKSWDDFEKELHGWYANDKTNSAQRELLLLIKQLK